MDGTEFSVGSGGGGENGGAGGSFIKIDVGDVCFSVRYMYLCYFTFVCLKEIILQIMQSAIVSNS